MPLHYRDIEKDLDAARLATAGNGHLTNGEVEMLTLRVLHVIASELDSISACMRMAAENAGKRGATDSNRRETSNRRARRKA